MKWCSKCKTGKPFEAFSRAHGKKDGFCAWCKECTSVYKAEHYLRNKAEYIATSKASQHRLRDFIREFKDGKSCLDCNVAYPHYVMDFDHRDAAEKSFILSRGFAYSKKRIVDEIAKCDLVCANCHRERTFSRDEQVRKDRTQEGS